MPEPLLQFLVIPLVKIVVLLGAVLLVVAYQFYRGFRGSVHSFEREGENIGRVSDEFLRALFGCMGHLAKSDGRVSEDEIRAASLQFVRKVSGFNKPSKANEAAFSAAVEEITTATHKLLDSLDGRCNLGNLVDINAKTGFAGKGLSAQFKDDPVILWCS